MGQLKQSQCYNLLDFCSGLEYHSEHCFLKKFGVSNKQNMIKEHFILFLLCKILQQKNSISYNVNIFWKNLAPPRDVEAVIFQLLPLLLPLPLPIPHLSLPLPPLPLSITKNEKTTVDNFFKLLWVCSLPSSTLHHFEKTKTFIYCYYFTYFA